MTRDTVPGLASSEPLAAERPAVGAGPAHRVRRQVDAPLLAVLYLVAALLSLYVSRQPGSVASIWYANAIGVVALGFSPRKSWVTLCLWLGGANATANWWWGDPVLSALAFLPANLLEMLLGAWLLKRSGLARRGLATASDLLQLLLLVGVLPQMLGASIGCATLAAQGLAAPEQVWLPWLEGSVIGTVSALPLAFLVAERGLTSVWLACRTAWVGMLLPVAVGLSLVALLTMPYAFVYLMLPLLLAATLVDLAAVAALTLIVSITVAVTLAVGLWAPPPMRAAWQQVFIYMAYAAALLPAQLLGAAMGALRRSQSELEARSLQLRRANEGLEQFVRIASHDLREPLNTVMQFGNLLQTDEAARLSPDGQRFLGFMLQGTSRMRRLLDDMLAFVRAQQGGLPDPQPVDLQPLLAELRQVLAHRIEARHARWEVGPMPVVKGQAVLLSLLFQNLLSNALKFVPPDRTPQVSVQARSLGPDRPGEVCIDVRDNGIGLSAADQERLFQPFQRLQVRRLYEGTGLGLAMAQQIAARHGSVITLVSQPGQGSVFSLVLPLAEAVVPAVDTPEAGGQRTSGQGDRPGVST